MTVKSILKAVLELTEGGTAAKLDGTGADDALLLRCLNMIVKEIAEEYVDFVKTEEVDAGVGKIKLNALAMPVKRVKAVRSAGAKYPFREREDHVITSASDMVEVEYAYYPDEVDFGDELTLPRAITSRALIYGVASEYCLVKERMDDSANFNSRYVMAISSCARPKGNVRVKERAWL
jgi:hypothetical protein